ALKIEPWLESSQKFWLGIDPLISEYNLEVAIENIFEDSPENLAALMQSLKSDRIGLCFDTGHFNLFSKVPLKEWLQATGRYIKELHIHDNDSTSDAHLAPSKGTFDFEGLFEFLEENSIVPVYTVEAHTPEDVLEALRYFEV
ncbi:MAG: sugar phosphate isomerase/epimerase, partial [Nitrospirae bacterium]